MSSRNSIRGCVRPSVGPFVRPSVRSSVRPSVRPSVRSSFRPSVRPSFRSLVVLDCFLAFLLRYTSNNTKAEKIFTSDFRFIFLYVLSFPCAFVNVLTLHSGRDDSFDQNFSDHPVSRRKCASRRRRRIRQAITYPLGVMHRRIQNISDSNHQVSNHLPAWCNTLPDTRHSR